MLGLSLRRCRRLLLAVPLLCLFLPSIVSAQCTPGTVNNGWGTSIVGVSIATLNNPSASQEGVYTDYTTSVAAPTILTGTSQTLTVVTNDEWWGSYGTVYIDWDGNSDFSESEEVYSWQNTGGTGLSNQITINFPTSLPAGLKRMRVMFAADWGFPVPPCETIIGEVEDYYLNVTPPTPDPAPVGIVLAAVGSTTPISPPVGAGNYDIGFILANVSGGALARVTANYTITGPQSFSGSVNWSGNLPVGGNVYVPLASNVVLNDPLQPYSVSITLTNAAGTQGPGDGNLANNSLAGFIAMALAGSSDPLNPNIYYVGGTPVPGQWFANLTDAGSALTYGGILGAVEFRVRPGTYNEQMLIGQISQTVQGIPGASPTKNVVITADAAAGGNVNNVIVSSSNTPVNNHTIQLNGADFVTFRNMTFSINNVSASAGRNIWLRNGNSNINFANCRFQGRTGVVNSSADALIYLEPTGVAAYANVNLNVSNCTFTNGAYSVYLEGGASGPTNTGLILTNNTFSNFGTAGVYVQRFSAPIVTSNVFNNTASTVPVTGIDLDMIQNGGTFSYNRVSFVRPGNGIRTMNNNTSSTTPMLIANNMINIGDGSSPGTNGVNVVSINNANIFHNTVNVNTPTTSSIPASAAFNMSSFSGTFRVVNNIFYNRGLGFAYYTTSGSLPTQSDYNNLFTAGGTLGFRNSANYATLSTFRSGTFEGNSRSIPVVFAGSTSTFLSQPEMQLRGTNSYNNSSAGNVNDDINSTARMAPPYMGAHELVPVVSFTSGPVDSTCTGGDITLRSRPVIKTVVDGTPYTLYDAASGNPAPSWVSFRWSKGGSPLFDQAGKYSGTKTMNLTIAATNFFDGDNYSMTATVKDGSSFRDNTTDTLAYTYAVTLKINEPVTIRRHPMSQVACRAGVVSLNVIASQGTIWGYQWYKDGQPLTDGNNIYNSQRVEGSRTVNLVLTGVDYQAAGRYMCMLQTSCGASSVPTDEAIVYVARPTKIGTAPMNQVVATGGTARFEVKVAELTEGPNVTPVKYMWYKGTQQLKDSPRISGANGPVLMIRNVSVADVASNYYVKVIGACGADSSASFSLSIGSITMNTQPSSADVCEGSTASMSVNATANGAQGLSLSYQWRKGNVNLSEGGRYSGTQSATLSISNVESGDAGAYNCVVSLNPGAIVTETSQDAALTVKPGIVFTTQPQSGVICEGQPAELTVVATGEGTLTYQWKLNGNDITGATSDKYSIASMKGTDAGNYSVVVVSDCGTKTSQVAMLKMKTKPVVYGPTESKLSIKAGGFLRLAVATVTDRSTKYRWYRGATPLTSDSITNAVYMKFGVATGTDAGKYYCLVTNDCGTTSSDTVDVTITTEVSSVEEENGSSIYLSSNEPNPFSGVTTIRFNLPQTGVARLTISDNYGRELAVIANGVYTGAQSVEFDPSVLGLSSGVYNYTLTTNGQSLTKKMIYVK